MSTHPLYSELILEHYRHPRHQPKLETFTNQATGQNPSCGDHVELTLQIENGQIKSMGWTGSGCALCVASTSLLSEWINKEQPTTENASKKSMDARAFLRGETTEPPFGKYQAFQSVCKHASRVKCAALPWHAFENSLTKTL